MRKAAKGKTRRPRGFGSIEQRGPTSYRVRFSVAGKRVYETIEAGSMLEASNRAAELQSPLWLVRAPILRTEPEKVSEPLSASGDAVAIALLIMECGGIPPRENRSTEHQR